jgi:hypothetical protein
MAISVRMTQSNWHAIDDDNGDDYYYKKSDSISVASSTSEVRALKEQLASLKKINSDLYGFAVEKLLKPFSDIQVQDEKSSGPSTMHPTASKSVLKAQKLKKIKKMKKNKSEVLRK